MHMPEGMEAQHAMEARRMQFEGLLKAKDEAEKEWSGVFLKLEESPDGAGVSAEINELIHKESALKEAIGGVSGEMKAEHMAAIEEWKRLGEQETMLLNDIVDNTKRYTPEEYKVILDQIKGVHERKVVLDKQIDATFEALINNPS